MFWVEEDEKMDIRSCGKWVNADFYYSHISRYDGRSGQTQNNKRVRILPRSHLHLRIIFNRNILITALTSKIDTMDAVGERETTNEYGYGYEYGYEYE